MGKLVLGSLLFVAGVFMCITGVGLLVGMLMAVIGMTIMFVGAVQVGWFAIKGTVAAAKGLNRLPGGN